MRKWLLLLVLGTVPGLAYAITDTVRIPIVEPHDDNEPAASFSHFRHGQFQCYECHSAIFPQYKKGFTHADMDRGKYCAACHDGRTAWGVDDPETECEECHKE